MVEKIPNTLKAGIKKDEAEKMKEILEKVGCKINILWEIGDIIINFKFKNIN